MRRIVLTLLSTLAAVIALLAYRPNPGTGTGSGSGSGSGGTDRTVVRGGPAVASAPGDASGPGSTAPSTGPTPLPGSPSRTVTGAVVQTQWGPVQVSITVSGSTVSAVHVLQQPSGNDRDDQINAYALPILTQEALTAQSARIDSVSGATYTSQGYVGSLQSALDRAGR